MAISDWSTTPGSNGSADAGINFAEGQAPSTINDSARSLMARVRHWFNWFGATTSSGGTSNAYTLTSGESLSAYVAGMRFAWSPNADSTGAVTINVDTIGAKKVYMPDGSQANTGDLDADSIYDLIYDTALDSSAGGFKIVGFPDAVTSGALLAANNLSDLANATTARTNLGVAIGSNVQAYDAGLADIAGLAVTDGNFIVANGSNWIVESGSTARTSLGLGSLATLSSVNDGNWSGTDLAVANGGTGASDAATARSNLGLGSLATLSSVSNSNWSGTDLAVANGGTGASDAATARTNLGAYGSGDSASFGVLEATGTLYVDPSGLGVQGYTSVGQLQVNTSGNTGILVHSGTTSTGYLSFGDGAVAGRIEYNHSSNYLTLWSNASERMRIDSSGNVGIGTTSPNWDLQVQNATNAVCAVVGSTTGTSTLKLGDTANNSVGQITYDHTSNYMSFNTSAAERMRLDSSGNVGIGTTSPGALLDVGGEMRAYAENNASVNGTLVNATHLKGAINGLNGNVTVPTATAGANGVLCGDGSARTVTRGSGLTMYVNGSNSASATLAARGVASILFTSSTVCYVSGDVS